MADFKDVVQSLKQNKESQDAGFSRLEAAVKGTDPKSIQEENAKKEASNVKKEQGYFANIADELSEVNKNLLDGFKDLKSPSGALGGLLGLIAAPIFFIKGFLKGLGDAFKVLGVDFKKMKLVKTIGTFFKTTIPNFFKNLFKGFSPKGGSGLDKILKNIKAGFKFVMLPFKMIGDIIKMFTGGGIGTALKTFKGTFSAITKFASTVGRVLGRLFFPITFLMTAFDTIKGAIDGFTGTEGNIVQKMLGALGGAYKGFMKIVTIPLDLVKDLISWIAGKFGFKEFEKLLDSFSFTKLFGKAVDWLFVDLPAFITDLFSWKNIKAMLSGALDFANEIGKSLQRVIHGAINWVKSLFGFGDKGDFAPPEMPVTKDVRAFLTFEWVSDLLKPVTDFFKKIMDFDFVGMLKKIPFVGKLLEKMESDKPVTETEKKAKALEERNVKVLKILENKKKIQDQIEEEEARINRSKANEDFGGDEYFLQNEKAGQRASQKKIAMLKKKLASESKAQTELLKLKKPSLKTANLTGKKPGIDIKDLMADDEADVSTMTQEELKRAQKLFNNRKNAYRGSKQRQFVKDNKDLSDKLKGRRQDFRNQAEEEGNVASTINQAQLDKVGKSAGTTTIIDNSVSAPSNTNNNSSTSTFSPLVQTDSVVAAAVGADF